MTSAKFFIFSDACPTDWLIDGHDEQWHTIANWVFQSDPALQPLVDQGLSHEKVLPQDELYVQFVDALKARLGSTRLKKWKTNETHRAAFGRAFCDLLSERRLLVTACSFQEKTLRGSVQALLNSYNRRIGGIEGRGIGFETFTDHKGRLQMKHSFVNFYGYHEIQAPLNQMLVLLFMSWFVADQYSFYSRDIVRDANSGFDKVALTVVSDKLSGDDDQRRKSEMNLRNLIDPESEGVPITLTRSAESDSFFGDLFVDNLAGFLNAAISNPRSDYGDFAREAATTGGWTGWHQLVESTSELASVSAMSRLSKIE